MRRLAALVTVVLALAGARAARSQETAARFHLSAVGDSTITFPLERVRWVQPGMHGIAVDPARHDALVARFEVLRVDTLQAVALVTGQTTPMTTDFVALLQRPPVRTLRQRVFWLGIAAGAVFGAAVALLASAL